MKTNKKHTYNSLFKKMENQNFNFTKKLKYIITASLFVMILACIVYVFCGFNYGPDYTGGYTFKVQYNTELTNEQKAEIKSEITEILNESDAGKYRAVNEGVGYKNALRIDLLMIQGFSDDEMKSLIDEITVSIEQTINEIDDLEFVTISDAVKVLPTVTSSYILTFLGAIGIFIFTALIYVFIRFGFTPTLSVAVSVIFDLLIVLSLTVLFRIEISALLLSLMLLMACYSIISNLINFDKIRDIFIKDSFTKLTNTVIVNNVIKNSITRIVLTTLSIIALSITLMFIGHPLAIEIGAVLIIISLITAFNSVVIAPSIWALTYNKDNDRRLQKKLSDNKKSDKENEKLVV